MSKTAGLDEFARRVGLAPVPETTSRHSPVLVFKSETDKPYDVADLMGALVVELNRLSKAIQETT